MGDVVSLARQHHPVDIGLRYVLESGLHSVRNISSAGVDMDVLKNLVEIFSEAARGSRAIERREFLIGIEDRPAFNRFSTFFNHLKNSVQEDLPARINEASTVFQQVCERQPVDPVQQERAAELVEKLLESMKNEAALARPVAPRSIAIE